MSPAPLPDYPLSGVRVLDLSRVLAGPWATQMLADMGADVLKIEHPASGDDTRGWGPPFVTDGESTPQEAAYYFCANRSKRSLALDFSKPEGAQLLRRLVLRADILVENYKLGGLVKYGLDYSSLHAIHPKLVYCSITGFGQTGPHAQRPGYDYIIQAMSGLMSVTGEPHGPPMKVGVAVADLFAGLYGAFSILAALRHAERTGQGQHLDVALLDCQIAALANQTQNYLTSGIAPGRLGNAHPNLTPYGPYTAKDGRVIVAVGNDGQFRALCAAIGAPALSQDGRFLDNRARLAHRDALDAALNALMSAQTCGHWLETLNAAGVPCGPIQTLAQALEDPQIAARALLVETLREDGARARLVRHPVIFSETPARAPIAPPRLGADGPAALEDWLGPDAAAINAVAPKPEG